MGQQLPAAGPQRTRTLAGAVAAACLLIVLAACGNAEGSSGSVSAAPPRQELPQQGPAPDFELTDLNDQRVRLSDLRGKVVLVSFFYTGCADFCPTMNTNLRQLREKLGEDGAEVDFLSISFDPLTDTPPRLREYTESQGFGGPGWRFLTGTPAEIAMVLGAYGIAASEVPPAEHIHDDGSVHPHGREFSHPAQALLVDAEGQVRGAYLGAATGSEVFSPELLAADIMTLLDEPAGA